MRLAPGTMDFVQEMGQTTASTKDHLLGYETGKRGSDGLKE